MLPNKAYLEITNACNLKCDFCHGTKREIKYMSVDEFTLAASHLRSFADYLYFHLMGEPLLHPHLAEFFDVAGSLGYKVIITTNGTLLEKRSDILLSADALYKVSISLHSYEANEIGIPIEKYLETCFDFCEDAAKKGIIAVMRLWNLGGKDSMNEIILDRMHARFAGKWEEKYSGYRLADKVFLEWGEKFDWPDTDSADVGSDHSCYGLRDQVGVLSDGTVVPCCLDADGVIGLGNIFEKDIQEIISCPRAVSLKRSFEKRQVEEELCRRCGFAARFKK